ncbi:superfamily II DNA/RNA helicase [Wenyingzhuangia heitensis]|uniref:Superfamily II DNA/RNA helicase n=1 Tax=Wenyingzhuangia heitensis TaxID=1487859 RepID=A0ABX0UGU3_9FLAO|nr:DEAD/DEAH box helicase [Wenyingzhuangia heitensis]NIJ46232.1 superfamily II DNA/RNA helicase [Wenyingzhuangia heitensis]
MSTHYKNQASILSKLGITQLNPMQKAAQEAINSLKNVVLLSPTGTGKTLAFLLPLIEKLSTQSPEVQAVIITPSRELAIQIEQVFREMGTGYKVNCVYGGRPMSKDKIELAHTPSVLIGTPGRIADHLRKGSFETFDITTLILDEFDKSLEVGFEEEMSEIVRLLPSVQQKILTSATQEIEIPEFVGIKNPIEINFLSEKKSQLIIKTVLSPDKDKLKTLVDTLCHIGNKSGIIFCNFKDSIARVSDYLNDHEISHGCFYGGLEQKDRERALIKFRNGTHQILIATDLAARGLDIPEIDFLIHYQLPLKVEEFTHRNGRTARMNSEGTAYVIQWKKEPVPDFITTDEVVHLNQATLPEPSPWKTLFISGGRQDKISKGDVAGLLIKKGNLSGNQVGVIELKHDCAFVSVKVKNTRSVIDLINNERLKKKKIRVTEI